MRFASDLATYEDLIDAWASAYAKRDWPIDTPQYLLAPYTRELARRARDPATPDAHRGKPVSGALGRLSALARSPSRHAFLLRATGSDYATLTEITNAQRLLADEDRPRLEDLAELAIYRHSVSIRGHAIPPTLPALWERLGCSDHAEALARTITSPIAQARALYELACAIAAAGDFHRALRVATDAEALAFPHLGTVWGPGDTADNVREAGRAAGELAAAVAGAGDLDSAERLAHPLAAHGHSQALTGLFRAMVQVGEFDRAKALASTNTDFHARAQALAGLVTELAEVGDLDRAETVAGTISEAHAQAQALAGLVTVLAQDGEYDRAETVAGTISEAHAQAQALAGLVTVLAQDGEYDRAETVAGTISEAHAQAQALAGLVTELAEVGDLDHAETVAGTIAEPYYRTQVLTWLIKPWAHIGEAAHAEALTHDVVALASTITGPSDQVRAMTEVVSELAQLGDVDFAEALVRDVEIMARTIIDPSDQAQVLDSLVSSLTRLGDLEWAEALARAIPVPKDEAVALARLASTPAPDDDPDRARRLTRDVEALVRNLQDADDQGEVITSLVRALIQAGDLDLAETMAGTITDPSAHARALETLISALTQLGDLDHAETLASTITEPAAQARALDGLIRAMTEAGNLDHAETMAGLVAGTWNQVQAVSELVKALTRRLLGPRRAPRTHSPRLSRPDADGAGRRTGPRWPPRPRP